jgi:peptidyl-tRNA hydrolase
MAASGAASDELLSALTDMGFESAAAAAALRATGSRNVEAAVLWLCGPDAAGDASALGEEPATGVPAASAYAVVHPDGTPAPAWVAHVSGEFKARAAVALLASPPEPSASQVVLCVVGELRMSVGKVAAQAAHAAVGLLRVMQDSRTPWLHAWEGAGEKTVVLDVPTAEAAEALAAKATQLGLPGALFALCCQTAGRAAHAPWIVLQCMRCWTQEEQKSRRARLRCSLSAVRACVLVRRSHAAPAPDLRRRAGRDGGHSDRTLAHAAVTNSEPANQRTALFAKASSSSVAPFLADALVHGAGVVLRRRREDLARLAAKHVLVLRHAVAPAAPLPRLWQRARAASLPLEGRVLALLRALLANL